MKEIRQILDLIYSTSSIKDKERILTEYKDNEQLFTLLQIHLNTYRQYYVAKLPSKRPEVSSTSLGGGTNYFKFLHMLGLLTSRKITGHVALATVYDFFQGCDEDEKWVFKKILLREALNLGAATVNKVRPHFIPEFSLMLADAKQPKLDEIKYPIIAQHKLDGFRAVYFPDQKTFLGRNGKPLGNQNLLTHFKDLVEKNHDYVIDGELYSDTLSFNEIASTLSSEDKPLDQIYYCVYDICPVHDWYNQRATMSYKTRINALYDLTRDKAVERVKVVETREVHSENEVQEFYKKALSEGLEGLMLKDPNGLYSWKRVTCKSGIMMKLKPSETLDGKIVGYEEGEGNFTGTLGALIVNVENIKNPVKVGTGFTEETRRSLWNSKETLKDRWIVLKCFEITENNESLRFPVFLSIRDSKD